MRHIISVDIGTTHCKAITVNENAVVSHIFKAEVESLKPKPGYHEQDAEKVFETVLALLQQSLLANQTNEIVAISFSAAMHGLMAVDISGKALTNIYTWADTRAATHAANLKASDTSKVIFEKSGTPIHPMTPLCKLLWMKQELPHIFYAAHKFISIKEYIFFRLFGKFIIDHSIASGTGLFDNYNLCWLNKSLQLAGIDVSKLSTPVSCKHSETDLLPAFQQKLNVKKSIPFIIGASDGCLANIGSGAVLPGEVALTIGTSGAVRMTTNLQTSDPKKRLFTYLLSEKTFITGGPTNNGGIALQWFAESFLKHTGTMNEKVAAVLQLATQTNAGAEKLLFLPYLQGERAPIWNANAKACFFGINNLHTSKHFARAVLEGICFALKNVLIALEESNGACNKIYISGGFIDSSFWVQLLADILNKELVVSNVTDASAMGAAFIAMQYLGIIKQEADIKAFISEEKIITPTIENKQLYTQLFALFQSLTEILKNSFATLEAI